MPDRVYLDWNATDAAAPRGARGDGGRLGRGRQSVLGPRRGPCRRAGWSRMRAASVAAAVGAAPQDVVFTSGGTEANALALTPGLRRGAGDRSARLLVSAIEHPSVLAGGRFPADAIEPSRGHRRRRGRPRPSAARCWPTGRRRWCR